MSGFFCKVSPFPPFQTVLSVRKSLRAPQTKEWEGEGESTKWVAGVKYMDGNRTELDFGWGSTQWSTQMLNYSLVHPLNYIMLLTNVTPISLIENKNIKTLLFGDFQSRWRRRQRWFAS